MCYRIELTPLVGYGLLLLLLSACQTEAPASAGNGASAVAAAESAAAESAERTAPPADAAAPANACTLLPASEVEPIIGLAVRDSLALFIPPMGETVPVSQCNYGTLRNPAAASLMLRGIEPGKTTQAASRSVREALEEAGIRLEEVSELGETSFWGANQLHVFAGNGWYLVVSPEPGVGLPQAREMAVRALSRF